MNARFETEKSEEKIGLLEEEKHRTRLFFGIFIVLAAVGLFFAWRAYSNKKKVAEFMASENHRKEVLLEEVNHRINNNLQIISSLLSLQANSADDERLKDYLQQSQNRIQSLASLHELLFMNDSSLKINMRDYLEKVLVYHKDILSTLQGKVRLELNVANDQFPPQVAVPVALIVNELVTNSLKYAFADGKDGQLNVSLLHRSDHNENWLLCVSDSGKGLPADDKFRKDSLGLRLVNLMTKQMKGVLTKSNSPGATFEITFRLPDQI
jgi:two-component system, sensor histidine kinase PdtaS